MAITATLSPNVATQIRARKIQVFTGKLTINGNYNTGEGISLDGIAKGLTWCKAQGGQYVWHFDPTTNKLVPMKFKDEITPGPADGTLIQAGATLEAISSNTVYYMAIKAEV